MSIYTRNLYTYKLVICNCCVPVICLRRSQYASGYSFCSSLGDLTLTVNHIFAATKIIVVVVAIVLGDTVETAILIRIYLYLHGCNALKEDIHRA